MGEIAVARRKPPADSTPSLFAPDDLAPGVEDIDLEDEDTEPRYLIDPSDGKDAEIIKPHSRDKHVIVHDYVDICRPVRRKWIDSGADATYVDLFCGPGRVCDSLGQTFENGSPLVAWNSSVHPSRGIAVPFSRMLIADKKRSLVDAAQTRLAKQEASVKRFCGEAEKTVDKVVPELGPGFHFVFLDPYGIKQLPFEIIRKLVALPNLDVLIHVSAAGLRRNLGFNVHGQHTNFDRFAPNWRAVYDPSLPDQENVRAIVAHWGREIGRLGKDPLGTLAISRKKVPLYWLVLVSGHPLAKKFWDKITKLREQQPLQLSLG